MKVKKAVFPVAGLGIRFLPATKAQPKEMLPLVDKPMIQYAVEEAIAAGIFEFVMVTGRGKRAIEDHFDHSFELEEMLKAKGKTDLLAEVEKISAKGDFIYIRQKKPLGLGHAVLCAKPIVCNEPFAVFLPDEIVQGPSPEIGHLLKIFEEKQCSVIALMKSPREELSRYGIIKPKGDIVSGVFEIEDLIEKPSPQEAPSDLAIDGRYILTPEIFACLEQSEAGAGGELQLTDGIRQLLKKQKVYGCVLQGNRLDAGEKLGFLQANITLALEREDLKEDLKNFLRELKF